MRKLLLIILFIPFHQLQAQVCKPYFSAIVVSNIDSSINWYKKILKVELQNRTDAPERGFIQGNLFNKDILIELIQVSSNIGADSILKNYPPRTEIRGFVKIGFRVNDIEAIWTKLKNQNTRFEGRMVTDNISKKKNIFDKRPRR